MRKHSQMTRSQLWADGYSRGFTAATEGRTGLRKHMGYNVIGTWVESSGQTQKIIAVRRTDDGGASYVVATTTVGSEWAEWSHGHYFENQDGEIARVEATVYFLNHTDILEDVPMRSN